jgi:hypothetical protein
VLRFGVPFVEIRSFQQPWSSPAAGEAWGGVPAQAWGRRRPTGGAAAARSSGEEAVGVRVARRSNGYCFLHESQTLEDGLGKKICGRYTGFPVRDPQDILERQLEDGQPNNLSRDPSWSASLVREELDIISKDGSFLN